MSRSYYSTINKVRNFPSKTDNENLTEIASALPKNTSLK